MVMPQALAQVTFPVTLQWSLTQLQEPHWLQYVCQLLEMSLTRVMRFEQSKVRRPFLLFFKINVCISLHERHALEAEPVWSLSFSPLLSSLCGSPSSSPPSSVPFLSLQPLSLFFPPPVYPPSPQPEFSFFTIWGMEPVVTHQTSTFGSTGACDVLVPATWLLC